MVQFSVALQNLIYIANLQPKIYLLVSVYCGRVKSTCLGAGKWQVAERKVVEEADEQ